MDPLTIATIASTGLNALSGVMGANAQNKLTREQLTEQRRQFDASSRQRAAEQALVAQNMDPLRQQKSRQRNALVSQLIGGAQPVNFTGNSFTGGLQIDPKMMAAIASYFTPEAAAAAESQFTTNAQTASGGQYAGASSAFGNPAMPAPMPGSTTGLPAGRAAARNLFYDGVRDQRRPSAESF